MTPPSALRAATSPPAAQGGITLRLRLLLLAARVAGLPLLFGLGEFGALGGVHRLLGVLGGLVDLARLDELRGALVVVARTAVASFAFDAALVDRALVVLHG